MEAAEWGIEVGNKPEWYTERIKNPHPDTIKGDTILVEYPWLNETGRAVITKQVRDARRASMKWWADMLIPLMALAVAFLALFKDVIVAYIQAPR